MSGRIDNGRNGRLDIAIVQANALAIGLQPSELDRMSITQIFELFEAYRRMQSPNSMSEAEKDDLWQWLQEKG